MLLSFFFFFNDTATTEIYTLSLHDALPICRLSRARVEAAPVRMHSVSARRDAQLEKPRLVERHARGRRPLKAGHPAVHELRLNLERVRDLEQREIGRAHV